MPRLPRRGFVTLLTTPLLAACGFRPVYAPAAGGTASPAAQGLAEISVGLIPERSGQLLRLALQERFERAGLAVAHRYDLQVAFSIGADAIAIRSDSTPTWIRMTGTATYSLIAQEPVRTTLKTGAARAVDGYNEFDQQFFTADLETDAVQRRIVQAVADQIALQLATYFSKRASIGTG